MLGDRAESEAGVEAEGRTELLEVVDEGFGADGGFGLKVAEESDRRNVLTVLHGTGFPHLGLRS